MRHESFFCESLKWFFIMQPAPENKCMFLNIDPLINKATYMSNNGEWRHLYRRRIFNYSLLQAYDNFAGGIHFTVYTMQLVIFCCAKDG